MKKQIIRILCVIIAVLVVAMSMPLGVFAATEPNVSGYIALDSEQTVYYSGSAQYYTFYPEESGLYLISSGGDLDTFVTVYDRNMVKLDSDDDGGENGNFALSLRLDGYCKYYVKLGAYGDGEFTVTATMPEAATDIAVCDSNGNTVDSIYGHTDESVRYFTKLLPDGSVGDSVVWSIADTDVAAVDSYGNITFKNEGSTTLTVTAGDLSATVPVVTASAIELVPEVENSISIPSAGDHLCIHFTAPDSNEYSFIYSNLEGLDISVYTQWGDECFIGEDISDGFTYATAAGSTLTIKVDYTNCTAESFSIKAEKIIYAESFDIYADRNGEKLYCDYYNLYVGDTLQLGCEAYPENSVILGDLTYYGQDGTVAEVTSNGFVTANKEGSITVNAQSYNCSDEITINVIEKEVIPFDETYNYGLNENNLGTYIGTFMAPEGGRNYKITFNATGNVKVQILNEYGDFIIEKSGSSGIIRYWLSDSFAHQVVITSENIHEDIGCNLTIEEYTPVDRLEIVDSEGNDFSQHYGEVGETFTLGCNIYPEDAVTELKWTSDNPEVAQVDEYGNVTFLKAGYAHICVNAVNDDGEAIDYLSDQIYVSAEKITDSYFGYSHYITIEDYTEKLRVTAPHTGYFYIQTIGNDNNIGVSVMKSSDNSVIDTNGDFISDTEYKYTVYLEKGTEYIIWFGGPHGNGYTIQLGNYDVPNRIDVTDTNGNIKTEHTGYVGDGIALDFKYDMYNCFREQYEWKSSDEEVARVDVGGYVNLLKAGNATLTVTTKAGLTASIEITVIEGKPITLDTPVTETLSYIGTDSVRFMFTPTVTAIYEINAVNTAGGEVYLDFYVLDSSYNEIALIENGIKIASAKLEAGKTYFIKAREQGMGGSYSFTLTNKTIGINTPVSLSMTTGTDQYISYYFIPEKTGYYLFKTSGYNDDGWGRGVEVYSDMGENISDFRTDIDSSLTYATLTAGNVYRASIFKQYWDAADFTFEITEAVGISSMEIVTLPIDSTVPEDTDDFGFTGFSLSVTTSDGNAYIWNYDESPQYICGYAYGTSYSEEVDGIRYAYIKAGGAVCAVPYTVEALETLAVNNPIQVTYGENSDEINYKFIPEKTGWYLFESYNHTVVADNRYMYILCDSMWITESVNDMYRLEMYAYLTAGESYVLRMYKYYLESDEFTLSVTEAVGIEAITVKQYPTNMTVAEGNTHNPDFNGLVLTVTTSDGQTRDWTYTSGANSIFGYMYQKRWSEYGDTVEYRIYAGGSDVALTYTLLSYPLESIEVITAGDITIVENTNGYYNAEGIYCYYVPNNKAKIKLNYNDGTFKFASIYDVIDGYYIDCYNSQTEKPWVKDGDNYFTVSFRDKSVNVPVKIVESTFQSIEVINDGDLTVTEGMTHYEPMSDGEGLWYYIIDYSDVKLKISFTDGTYVIASPEEEVRGLRLDPYSSQYLNPIEAGKDNYITVTYGTASVNLPVTVLDNGIESVTLTKTPTEPYIYGDLAHGNSDGEDYRFHPSFSDGYEFTVKYDNGSEVVVSDADFESEAFIAPYPSIDIYSYVASQGTNKAFFAWGGTVIDFDIELVASDVASIEVLELPTIPEGLEYYPDMVGLKLLITYTDETTKTVTLSESDISYEGNGNIRYIAYVDGEMLTVEHWNEGEYRINYKGADAYFNIGSENSFYINNLNLVDFDNAGETVTVSYIYGKNGREENRTLQIDLSVAEKNFYDSGTSYQGLVKNEKGIFGYYFSYYANADSGLVNYSIGLMNNSSNGYLLDSAGDITGDGTIDVRDLVRLKKLAANSNTPIASPADFDGDGRSSATDIAYLRKCIFGMARLSVIDGDANGDGYLDYNDPLAIAMYLAGSEEMLSSRADINTDGVIDQKDIDLINSML